MGHEDAANVGQRRTDVSVSIAKRGSESPGNGKKRRGKMMRIGRGILCCLVLGALVMPLAGKVAYGQAKSNVVVKEWYIPTIHYLTGPMAGIGADRKWLEERLWAEINASGGIAGKPLVSDICDSALDPTKSAACMAKAIDAGDTIREGVNGA